MKKNSIVLFCCIAILSSCIKDRTFTASTVISTPIIIDTTHAFIVANEFVATGSTLTNEYGKATDWIELYNPSNYVMDFTKENIYITDSIGFKNKFKLTNFQIQPHQFLVIFCDTLAKVGSQIHTNFALSKGGEFVGVYRKNTDGTYTTFTEHPFGLQTGGKSEGQKPDGSNVWTGNLTPTPGTSNN
ncbi:MAG: hypothetical protein RI955_734 [Bacteroidota bacterium]|jgi:hypothetical protein